MDIETVAGMVVVHLLEQKQTVDFVSLWDVLSPEETVEDGVLTVKKI